MEEVSYRDQFGVPVEVNGEGMTLNALRFEVADLAELEASLRQGGIAARRRVGRLIVPPDLAFGATLIFEGGK